MAEAFVYNNIKPAGFNPGEPVMGIHKKTGRSHTVPALPPVGGLDPFTRELYAKSWEQMAEDYEGDLAQYAKQMEQYYKDVQPTSLVIEGPCCLTNAEAVPVQTQASPYVVRRK